MAHEITAHQFAKLTEVAAVLLPGDDVSPPAPSLPDFPRLLTRAVAALGHEAPTLTTALDALPPILGLGDLRTLRETQRAVFDLIAATVAGAYFTEPDVLKTIGYPTGRRTAAPFDLAADQLSDGLLDGVQAPPGLSRMTSRG